MTKDNKGYFLSRLFTDYIKAHNRIKDIKSHYLSSTLDYEEIEKDTRLPQAMNILPGFFYKFKEHTHYTRKIESLSDVERPLCWLIETDVSDVFHTMTKLRETMYQIDRNVRQISCLQSSLEASDEDHDEEITRSLDAIIGNDKKARNQVGTIINDAMYLVDSPKYVVIDLVELNKDEDSMIRSIYGSLDGMRSVYGPESTQEIMEKLYSVKEEGFSVITRDSMLRRGFNYDASCVNDTLPEFLKIDMRRISE